MLMLVSLLLGAAPPKPPAVRPPDRPTVPILDLSTLAGCPDDQVRFAVGTIAATIEVGAPLYNSGDRAACYRLYLGAAADITQHVPACPGLQQALGGGITRAATLPDYTSQAWAMRDAFDGVLYLYERAMAEAAAAPPPASAPAARHEH
jgi:hypothetical protein